MKDLQKKKKNEYRAGCDKYSKITSNIYKHSFVYTFNS